MFRPVLIVGERVDPEIAEWLRRAFGSVVAKAPAKRTRAAAMQLGELAAKAARKTLRAHMVMARAKLGGKEGEDTKLTHDALQELFRQPNPELRVEVRTS